MSHKYEHKNKRLHRMVEGDDDDDETSTRGGGPVVKMAKFTCRKSVQLPSNAASSAPEKKSESKEARRTVSILAATEVTEGLPGELPSAGAVDVGPQQCTSVVQCSRPTVTGQYCAEHLSVHENLAVLESTLPGAGLGLFSARGHSAGQIVGRYTGKRLQSNAGEDALAGPYLLAISAHEYIDAAASNTNPTRYINDGCSADLNNARLECRTDGTVYVTMTAACRPGEEILMSYGDEYWAHSVESDVDALRMQASCISLDDEEEKVDVAPFPRHMYASPTAALEDPLALTPA